MGDCVPWHLDVVRLSDFDGRLSIRICCHQRWRSKQGRRILSRAGEGRTLSQLVYSPLDASGYYIAPLFQLCFQKPDPQGRSQIVKRSKKTMHQTLTYEDNCFVVGVFWHIMHWSELCHGDRSLWIAAEGRFKANFELDPHHPWNTVTDRSRTAHLPVLMSLLTVVRWIPYVWF